MQQEGTDESPTFLLNTPDGQQILLNQQAIFALAAAGGDIPQFITADGQQIELQNTPQEILAAIGLNADIISSLLAGQQCLIPEDEFTAIQAAAIQQSTSTIESNDQLVHESESAATNTLLFHEHHHHLQIQPILSNKTNETNAILTQPPIMSTLEQPRAKIASSTNGNAGVDGAVGSEILCIAGVPNLDQSLATIIGVTSSHTNVPTSLELPITITNPAIAQQTSSSNQLYTSIGAGNVSVNLIASQQMLTTIHSTVENISSGGVIGTRANQLSEYDLFNNIVVNNTESGAGHPINGQLQLVEVDELDMDTEDIVPVTPESDVQRRSPIEMVGFGSETSDSSGEIPLQSNLVNSFPVDNFNRSEHLIVAINNGQPLVVDAVSSAGLSVIVTNDEEDDDASPGFTDAHEYIEQQLIAHDGTIVDNFNDEDFNSR